MSCGRKLIDLRVLDLKEELEKRSLDITGNKNVLLARLQKAVKDEGNDPDKYLFEPLEKRGTPKKATNPRDKTNGDVCNNAKKREDENEVVIDEVGTVDNEEFEENEDNEGSQEDCNNDTSMNDNEESINLTIEEDEQKLLHAQATDDKDKKPDKKAKKVEGDSKDDDKEEDVADKKDKDDLENGDGDNKDGSADDGDEKTKKDDSEQKSSSKTSTSKDEKDKSASKTKSSSSPSSRNLWVSKLSPITRASDLKAIFSQFGKVIGAKVVTNTRNPGSRCYGYVTMNSSADATKCIQRLDHTELHGHIISVKSEIGGRSGGGGSSTTSRDKKSLSKSREIRKSEDKDKKKDDKETDQKPNEDAATESATDNKKTESGGDRPKSETSRRDGGRLLSRSSRDRNRSRSSRNRDRDRECEILSKQLREERDWHRNVAREDERRRRDIRMRQREEELRLRREREKLQMERERLEREKAELLRLERERQTLEREKIELERLELKRQQMKIMQSARVEETKRPVKRSSSDRYTETDRKRSNTDRRFEAPPPPRFDTALAASRAVSNYERPTEKKRDDYVASKRDDYKRDLDIPRHATNYQENTRDNHKESRYAEPDPRSNFRRADERDSRNTGVRPAYADRSAGGNSQWHNSGPPAIKSFAGSSMTSGGGGIPNWPAKAADSHWRQVESQDRYDRTYNERSGGGNGGQYIDPARMNMFVGRPQDRYGGQMSSRYENGKY